MSMLEDLKKLTELGADKIFTYAILMLSLIVPGISIMYYSNPDFFLKLTPFNMFILSLVYSTPLFIISLVVTAIFLITKDAKNALIFGSRTNKPEFYRNVLNSASLTSLTLVYCGLLQAFLVKDLAHVFFWTFILSAGMVIAFGVIKLFHWFKKKPKKNTSKNRTKNKRKVKNGKRK